MAVQAANSSAITVGGALGMCSDKQYLLGGRSLISEPGEWALDSVAVAYVSADGFSEHRACITQTDSPPPRCRFFAAPPPSPELRFFAAFFAAFAASFFFAASVNATATTWPPLASDL